MGDSNFYWRHLRLPLILFALLAPLLATTSADLDVAHALFFDEVSSRWIGADSWWTNQLIHRGGALLIRGLAAASLILWATTWWRPQWRELRRPALFFFLSLGLSVGAVGLLKALTNVDCPRDLSEFGGTFPFIHLFADRPEALRHARCFPAAHASSGYALVALYFALRERSRWTSRLGLVSGLVMGLIFGIAQQARGAHFVSHDVWSAWLVWTISLSLYTFAFKARLWGACPGNDHRHEDRFRSSRLTRAFRAHSRSYVSERIVASCRSEAAAVDGHCPDRLLASLHRSHWEHNEASAATRRLPVNGDADLPRRLGSVPGA